METAGSSEMPVTVHIFMQCHIPEGNIPLCNLYFSNSDWFTFLLIHMFSNIWGIKIIYRDSIRGQFVVLNYLKYWSDWPESQNKIVLYCSSHLKRWQGTAACSPEESGSLKHNLHAGLLQMI
jgi:hypothetical protein